MCIIFLFYTKIDLQVLYSLSLTKINALSNCTKVMIHAELLYDNDLTLELSITQFLLFFIKVECCNNQTTPDQK